MKKIINPITKEEYLINKFTLIRKKNKKGKKCYEFLIRSTFISDNNGFIIRDEDGKTTIVKDLKLLSEKQILKLIKIMEDKEKRDKK